FIDPVTAAGTRRLLRRSAAILLLSPLVFCFSACSSSRANSASAGLPKPVPAHVYTVAEETTRRQIQTVGSLCPWEESELSSQVEARVSDVLADVGDSVKEGQPLVLLDKQELQYAVDAERGAVMQVRAQLGVGPSDPVPTDARSQASVQKAQADYEDAKQ